MTDDREEIRFLLEKASQLRALARKHRFPPDHELYEIAEEFERLARDLERRR